MSHPPTLSPVDYDAWNRGYMPPSEHILIDQLAHRGACVVMSSDNGQGKGAIWVVMRDRRVPRKHMRALMVLTLDCLDDDEAMTCIAKSEY